jgi:putative aminopeptidase FrvX
VADTYFQKGTAVRLMPGGSRARLGEARRGAKIFELHSTRPVAIPPRFAVWEVTDFDTRDDHLYGRACDDLIGVSCILAALIELRRARAKVDVIGALTRAEEVGFHGALALATGDYLPKQSLVISLETSKELPGAKMGKGVIIRVGDRSSVFDSAATRFLGELAGELKQQQLSFNFQRALMSGGTCEGSAYQEFGFKVAALCVALGNYHNCGAKNKIRSEFVSVNDSLNMIALLVAAANAMSRYDELAGRFPKRLKNLLREARTSLTKSSCLRN